MSSDGLISLGTGGYDKVQNDWMHATAIRPLAFDDPGLIWLDYHGEVNGFKPDSSPYGFLSWIAGKGKQFEARWIRELASTAVTICTEDFEVRSQQRFVETVEHILAGTPVIARPALWWAPERIYGVPDLIVHTSWLAQNFPQIVPQYEDETPAPGIHFASKPGHYVVFDIKFTTGLDESSKKKDYASYSSQARIYSYILGHMQELTPRHAYLITRDHPFDPMPVKVASVLGRPLDADLATMRDCFIEIKLQGAKYLPWRDTAVESNLSNNDEGWSTAKHLIARDRFPGRDPVLLYQVSRSIRRELDALGFANLDSLLAIHPAQVPFEQCKGLGQKKARVMRAVLEANRSGKVVKPAAALVPPARKYEFFVDFEYLTNLNVDFENQWPKLEGKEMVFMIGVGRISPSGWEFVPFISAAETPEAECEMFLRFTDFLMGVTAGKLADSSETVLYHWTAPEVWQATRSADRLCFDAAHPLRSLPWFDLQKPFTEGPAALPNAWGYGLKEIASALRYISPELAVEWPEDLSDGLSAMVMGWLAYSQPEPLQSREMRLLTEYLKIDCASLEAIIRWLRS